MTRINALIFPLVLVGLLGLASGQTKPPASDPQAVAYAAQSIAAMAGAKMSDVTMTGNATWSGKDSGTATLKALDTTESRMDLFLTSGPRTEIRDSQTGTPLGGWINPDKSSGTFALHNCQTDAAWFFPALGSLKADPNIVLSYVGKEERAGATVQHIQSYVYQPTSASEFSSQSLNTMDFYLDATSLLPVATTFNAHPDNDMLANLLIEIDFSNYQDMEGVLVPTHIQKYLQGSLLVDLTITNAAINSGLPLSDFTVN